MASDGQKMLDLSRVRVLVVDDHGRMREIIRTILAGLGLRHVEQASSGEQCLERLRLLPFDLVIIDYDMGGANGVEVARQIRRDHGHRNQRIPMIMLTGRGDAPTVLAARDAGLDEFLAKPVSPTALAQRIEAAVSRQRPFTASPDYVGPDRRRRRDGPYAGPERRG